jgi:hypothetical protein
MNVGFTGTREGMTDAQKNMVRVLLTEFRTDDLQVPDFHHGNCIGADDEALEIANELDYYTIAHPTDMPRFQIDTFKSDEVRKVKQPLKRNRDIVRESDVMIATPKETMWPETTRGSGTWFTIEHCRKQNVMRKCHIVWPDGKWQIEGVA